MSLARLMCLPVWICNYICPNHCRGGGSSVLLFTFYVLLILYTCLFSRIASWSTNRQVINQLLKRSVLDLHIVHIKLKPSINIQGIQLQVVTGQSVTAIKINSIRLKNRHLAKDQLWHLICLTFAGDRRRMDKRSALLGGS